jgi:FKBP12-rapamycin complex-associated protein
MPQPLIFPLLVAKKSPTLQRKRTATIILNSLEIKFPDLIKQSTLISEELNRVAILMEEEC